MAERRPLEVVLFDAGGTLVRLDFEWMSECLASLGAPVGAGELRRAEVEGRRAYDRSNAAEPRPSAAPLPLGSHGDTHAYFGGMLDAAAVPERLRPRVLERFYERHAAEGLWTRPMEGARIAIDGVRALGLRAAVVSNSDGRAEKHLIDCGVRDGLEFVIDSTVVGVEKPDPLILELALARLAVTVDRALFVGDIRSVDEAVARRAGMSFALIDPFGDYAPAGTPSLAGMRLLPQWIASRFVTPQALPTSL